MNPLTAAIVAVLVKSVFPVITAIVAAFAIILAKKIAAKLHLQNDATFVALITSVSRAGAVMAEEAGLAAFKHRGIKITSSGKLDMNVAHIIDTIPSVSRVTAERYANLAVASIKGLGASGNRVIGEDEATEAETVKAKAVVALGTEE